MGHAETLAKAGVEKDTLPQSGPMSFCETIHLFQDKPKSWGADATVIFQCEESRYQYRNPKQWIDSNSAVICYPNNFEPDNEKEGACLSKQSELSDRILVKLFNWNKKRQEATTG